MSKYSNRAHKSLCAPIKYILLFSLLAALILPNLKILAGETSSSNVGLAMSPEEERAALEKELKELEDKIAQYENDINKTQQEKNTLQNQVSILKKKISQLDLQINQSNLMIKDIGLQIVDTEGSIDKTSLKIEDSKEKLANILRTIDEEGQKSLLEILLYEPKLSDFFDNMVALEALNQKNQELLKDIKDLKTNLEGQKQTLDDEKTDLEKMTKIQILQRTQSLQTKSAQEKLLEQTKGKESEYQKMLQASKARAAKIRARLFELVGVVKAPTFGQALEIAKFVEGITGVRPAFLLAVLTQESNIGKNVGQCYLPKDPYENQRRRIMSPTRDVPNFLSICQALGRDPYSTSVSCPMSYGWGGAMGPAQFIPSTWVIYEDRVRATTGSADPWNIKDAFVAAALYLANAGAASQNPQAEWRAAMIYFSGSTSSKYRFYGDSVMAIAGGYEEDIRTIEKTLGMFSE